MSYTPRTFTLPTLTGLSSEQIAVHLALYEGYVKHTNLILETIQKLRSEDAEANAFVINELRRRLGFEFDGMRMHEYYFEQFEGGASFPSSDGPFHEAVVNKHGSFEGLLSHLKEVAGTRGIGWVVLYFDKQGNTLHTAFVNDHEVGQLAGLPILLAIDLWEHAYMVDYVPAERKSYVEAFLDNVHWGVVENRLTNSR